jgi:hypothetical protein
MMMRLLGLLLLGRRAGGVLVRPLRCCCCRRRRAGRGVLQRGRYWLVDQEAPWGRGRRRGGGHRRGLAARRGRRGRRLGHGRGRRAGYPWRWQRRAAQGARGRRGRRRGRRRSPGGVAARLLRPRVLPRRRLGALARPMLPAAGRAGRPRSSQGAAALRRRLPRRAPPQQRLHGLARLILGAVGCSSIAAWRGPRRARALLAAGRGGRCGRPAGLLQLGVPGRQRVEQLARRVNHLFRAAEHVRAAEVAAPLQDGRAAHGGALAQAGARNRRPLRPILPLPQHGQALARVAGAAAFRPRSIEQRVALDQLHSAPPSARHRCVACWCSSRRSGGAWREAAVAPPSLWRRAGWATVALAPESSTQGRLREFAETARGQHADGLYETRLRVGPGDGQRLRSAGSRERHFAFCQRRDGATARRRP